jgi:lipid A 4'-phosphatase
MPYERGFHKVQCSNTMDRNSNPFGFMAKPAFALGALVLWIAVVALFHAETKWDLAVARWFFDPVNCAATETANHHGCDGFFYARVRWLVDLRLILQPLAAIMAVIAAVLLVRDIFRGKRWLDGGIRLKAVLIATLAIGPGIIVNGILKNHWGRPRPWMTDQFGGWLPFVAAGEKTDYCLSNCSFISGESAAAGWLMCVAILMYARQRTYVATGLLVAAFIQPILRVAFDAHYLSDAVLGFSLTIVLFMLLAMFSEISAGKTP